MPRILAGCELAAVGSSTKEHDAVERNRDAWRVLKLSIVKLG